MSSPLAASLGTALDGDVGLIIVGLLAMTAVAGIAYVVLTTVLGDKSPLARALEPYGSGGAHHRDDATRPLARIALLRTAVDRAARVAQLGPVLDWVETKLDQANLALRPPEALFAYSVVFVVCSGAALLVGGPLLGFAVAVLLALVPPAGLSARAEQRLRLFTVQLPDALILTASSLKAGYSFLQGIEAVSQEVREPMASELRRVMIEARLGRPVEEALDDCAARMKSPDFDWAVKAVGIQREVGGNLA
ncbi:MAG: type II secretion system F family protein, partial [Acidimicrobiales bacterium]